MAKINSKKKTKVDPEGIAFIKATFNNTVITLADKFGNVITWSSAADVVENIYKERLKIKFCIFIFLSFMCYCEVNMYNLK